MSGHRRVKDYSYDPDEFDDYDQEDEHGEGGDEMTAEDKENMRQGTIAVREALGSGFPAAEAEIQEALWHYYYDVGKSVTYLKNKYTTPKAQASPQQKKKESRFDQAASTAAKTQVKKPAEPVHEFPVPIPYYDCRTSVTTEDLFKDTPWLNVPLQQRGEIFATPLLLREGLLGGSSKPSKLAALAAARKKKQEEERLAKVAANADGSRERSEKAVALLDSLGAMGKDTEGAFEGPRGSPASYSPPVPPQSQAFSLRPQKSPSPTLKRQEEKTTESGREPENWKPTPDLRASPSAFAKLVFGDSSSKEVPMSAEQDGGKFSMTYASNPSNVEFDPFADPSPDAVVLSAQAKGKNASKKASGQQNGTKGAEGATNGVAGLTVSEAPRVKCKNLDVPKEFEKSNLKRGMNFVVIGHVDHGKSTLMGRLLSDLAVVDQKSVEKLRKEAGKIGKGSFALAWVMDQTTEERERGVTVDIATNAFETDLTHFTILDAPGHRDFIPNMIAGASQADFAVLVIDSGTNSFESGLKGQTKEHALLARSIGVQRLIIAVNKMDLASWSEARYTEISQQMSAFLTSAGFQPKNLAFIPCSGLDGENIVKPPSNGEMSWYKGNTLVQELDAAEPVKRSLEKPLRLTISDVFKSAFSSAPSISGRIDAGHLQVGEQVLIMPSGEKAAVNGIDVDGEARDWAVAGQIVNLRLFDIDPVHLRLGDIVCAPANPAKNVAMFTAKILTFEHVMPMYIDIHRGRLHVSGRVVTLLAVLDKGTGEVTKRKPRVVQPGAVARVRVEMDASIPLEAGDRVILRANGQTVAAGLLDNAS